MSFSPPSESAPELLTDVKLLTGSTAEIAAASVGEKDPMETVQQTEGEGKGHEVLETEALEEASEEVAKEASEEGAVVEGEEEVKSGEGEKSAEDAQTPAAEEVITEVTSALAAAVDEEAAAGSHPEETTSPMPTVDEAEAEVRPAPEEAIAAEDAASDEATVTNEAAPLDEISPADQAAAETPAEETAEAAVSTTQLAAASAGADLKVLSVAEAEPTSGAPVHEEKPCHSCHSAPSAGEEVAPPAAVGEELITDGAVDTSQEAKDAASAQSKNKNPPLQHCFG